MIVGSVQFLIAAPRCPRHVGQTDFATITLHQVGVRDDEDRGTLRRGGRHAGLRRRTKNRSRPVTAGRSRRTRYARRRKRRLDRVEHDLTDEEWSALVTEWEGCAYCGASDTALQGDCVLAISRGGRYTLDNVVPACRSCNTSKCNDEVSGWLRRKRLNERAFLMRQHDVCTSLIVRFPRA